MLMSNKASGLYQAWNLAGWKSDFQKNSLNRTTHKKGLQYDLKVDWLAFSSPRNDYKLAEIKVWICIANIIWKKVYGVYEEQLKQRTKLFPHVGRQQEPDWIAKIRKYWKPCNSIIKDLGSLSQIDFGSLSQIDYISKKGI